MTVVLRPMSDADLPAVLRLEQELFGAESWSREMLSSELKQLPDRYYLVAVAEQQAAGNGEPTGGNAGPAPGNGESVTRNGEPVTRNGGPAAGESEPVAHNGGRVAGYAGLYAPAGGQADVLTIGVAQRRWGEGIGSRLLDALLAEAARRGCPEVFLEVRVDNERAQRLYRRRGFARIGLRRGYYQPSGTDAVVMRLKLRTLPAPGAAARPGEARARGAAG